MRFRSKDEIQKHLVAQQTSGMTISAYCRQEKISQNSFFNWCKRFAGPQDISSAIPFLKLPFVAPAVERLDLILPNGARISAPMLFGVPILRDVVRLLAPLRPHR
jgi:hypothetical protein